MKTCRTCKQEYIPDRPHLEYECRPCYNARKSAEITYHYHNYKKLLPKTNKPRKKRKKRGGRKKFVGWYDQKR